MNKYIAGSFCLMMFALVASVRAQTSPANFGAYLDLNAADSQNYVRAQLTAAGITADAYPALYSSLAKASDIYAQAKAANINMAAVADGEGTALQPINVLAPNVTAGTVSAEAVSSVPNTPLAVVNSIGINSGPNVVAAPQGSVTVGSTGHIVTTVSGTAQQGVSEYQANGVSVFVYPASAFAAGPLRALSLPPDTPVAFAVKLAATFSDATGTTDIVNVAPSAVKGNAYMKLCIARGDADCDYVFAPTGSKFLIQMPITGSVTFPLPLLVDPTTGAPINPHYDVAIWYPDVGGGCSMPDSAFASQVTVTGNVLSWYAAPAQFGLPCSQIPYGQTQAVVYQLTMQMQSTSNTSMPATITTAQGPTVANTLRLLPMEFVYGCLAPGTEITMANGRKRRIETVKADEYLRGTKSQHKVTGYTRGPEKRGLYEVVTANNRRLRLTEMHPVPLTDGQVKLAKELHPDDVVTTEKGPSKIVQVTQVHYDGIVWNLNLGGPAPSKTAIDIEDHTFYANGILVGDGRAQTHFSRKREEKADEVLARLPPEWHTDFHNAQLRTLQQQSR
jgi:hypothetical protein